MMILIIAAALGTVMNAVRGGQHAKHVRNPIERKVGIHHDPITLKPIKPLKWYQWIVNRLLDGDVINTTAYGLFIGIYSHWALGISSAVGMFAGAAFGWGAYIVSMAYNKIIRKQVKVIDWSIQEYKKNPKRWGFVGLTRRGALWGIFLGGIPYITARLMGLDHLVDPVIPIVFCGLMGVVYAPFMMTAKKGEEGRAWELAEWAFGPLVWLGGALSIGIWI